MEGESVECKNRGWLRVGAPIRPQPQVFPDSSPHLTVSHGKHLNSWLQMQIPATTGPKCLILVSGLGTPRKLP